MIVVLVLAGACTPPEEPAADVPGVSLGVEGPDSAEPVPVDTIAGPHACPEPIRVAQEPSDALAPLADADADLVGADATVRQLHLAWTGDPATTATFLWRTDAETMASHLEIGETAALGTRVVGASFLVEGADTWPRVHEVHVCGLTPGTPYRYLAGVAPDAAFDGTFTTAPAPGEEGLVTFAVAGDSRGSPATWGAIVEATAEAGAEFRLFSGDAVSWGGDVEEWDEWFAAGAGHIESVATVSVHGNHESEAQAYYALNGMPGNERWYSLDYGQVHLAVIDDEVYGDDAWREQAEWLQADLQASTARWKFVAHHEPAFSSSLTHATNEDEVRWIAPVEQAAGVAIDFAGHNHHYERTLPLRGGTSDETRGVTYVITGGAGAPLYDNDGAEWYTKVVAVMPHYVIVRADGHVLTLLVYDLAGNLIDTYVRQK